MLIGIYVFFFLVIGFSREGFIVTGQLKLFLAETGF
jgi:hypothetical protein